MEDLDELLEQLTVNKGSKPPVNKGSLKSSNQQLQEELDELLDNFQVKTPSTKAEAPAIKTQPIAKEVHFETPSKVNASPKVVDIPKSTGEQSTTLSEPESRLGREINAVRTNPTEYARILEEDRLPKFDGKMLELSDLKVLLETEEGSSAVREAIAYLRNAQPLSPLTFSYGMTMAARNAAGDIGSRGALIPPGSIQRLNEWGTFEGEAVEIVSFGELPAREVVLRFLVGDGNKDRVHRKHLFNPKYKFVGIAIDKHASDFKSLAVVNFTPNFYDN